MPDPQAELNNGNSPPRILIVDDDTTMRLLMTETLEEDGYLIDSVDNGTDALEIISATLPELVILDVRMPGLSGFDVCKKIREQFDDINISIVMVTGLEDSASIEKAFELGATAFIGKPINWITFPYRIQYILKARSAFVALQERELHLSYLDKISRILTQDKAYDVIMQEVLLAMLDIFDADRAFVLKSSNQSPEHLEIDCGVTRGETSSVEDKLPLLMQEMEQNILYRAEMIDHPIHTDYSGSDGKPTGQLNIHQQLIQSLHLQHTHNWFMVIQQCHDNHVWSEAEQKTFNRLCFRLSGMLSRHLLVEKLHRSEQLLQQAQRIGHLGNWNWNTHTRQLTWSDEVYRIYGYEPDSFNPEFDAFYRVAFDDDLEQLKQHRKEIYTSGKAYSIEYRIRLPYDNVYWVHEQGYGTLDDNGTVIEVNGTIQDITDRRISQEQEAHEQKMESIGQLTSGVAHDFGNLMTVAKGNLELLHDILEQEHQLSEEGNEILEDARSAIYDGVELTKQLLSFSRKKSIAPEYINIKQHLDHFAKLLKHTFSDNIVVTVDIEDNLPDIFVDPIQLETALLNVCINARNAMHNGGDLKITAALFDLDSHTAATNLSIDLDKQSVAITIKDTGTGMSEEVVNRAIEPFYTTSKGEGTGLGLSMVYGFMRQSRGELLIDSVLNKGSTLRLIFPVLGGRAESDQPKTIREPAPLQRTTILIVEDREPVRQFAVRCLQDQNMGILQAENADEARRIMEATEGIDIVFTDIVMPGESNGRELACWVRQHYPEVKILLTTASEKQIHYRQPNEEQHFPLLPKPYSKQELIKSIHSSLNT